MKATLRFSIKAMSILSINFLFSACGQLSNGPTGPSQPTYLTFPSSAQSGDLSIQRRSTLESYKPEDEANRIAVDIDSENRLDLSVGRIEFGEDASEFCTGSVVGAGLVLANAHCADENHPARFVSSPRKNNEGEIIQYTIGIKAAWVGTRQATEESWDDWGLFILEGAVAADMPILAINSNGRQFWSSLHNVGFAMNFGQGFWPYEDRSCYIEGGYKGMLMHRCDTYKGASGSPLLSRENEIIAINAAKLECKGCGNLAVSPTRFMSKYNELKQADELVHAEYYSELQASVE